VAELSDFFDEEEFVIIILWAINSGYGLRTGQWPGGKAHGHAEAGGDSNPRPAPGLQRRSCQGGVFLKKTPVMDQASLSPLLVIVTDTEYCLVST
jgi:hypothetical protein